MRLGRVFGPYGVVDHYTTLNTLSQDMQIESDIVPPA
jgi:hypothetical protein